MAALSAGLTEAIQDILYWVTSTVHIPAPSSAAKYWLLYTHTVETYIAESSVYTVWGAGSKKTVIHSPW